MWTGEAGKELSMHVCVAQAPAGKIDWSYPYAEKCLLEFSVSDPNGLTTYTGLGGAIWADNVHSTRILQLPPSISFVLHLGQIISASLTL